MAIDKLYVTENLPDVWQASPAPTDESWMVPVYSGDGIDRMADAVVDYARSMHQISWWEAAFCGIGAVTVAIVGWVIVVGSIEIWSENRRRDRLVVAIARRAWHELSPADLVDAEKRWPDVFLVARHLIEIERQSVVERTRMVLDAWFGKQRADAVAAAEIEGRAA
jgi:hypothetical protein